MRSSSVFASTTRCATAASWLFDAERVELAPDLLQQEIELPSDRPAFRRARARTGRSDSRGAASSSVASERSAISAISFSMRSGSSGRRSAEQPLDALAELGSLRFDEPGGALAHAADELAQRAEARCGARAESAAPSASRIVVSRSSACSKAPRSAPRTPSALGSAGSSKRSGKCASAAIGTAVPGASSSPSFCSDAYRARARDSEKRGRGQRRIRQAERPRRRGRGRAARARVARRKRPARRSRRAAARARPGSGDSAREARA